MIVGMTTRAIPGESGDYIVLIDKQRLDSTMFEQGLGANQPLHPIVSLHNQSLRILRQHSAD
jgi:hypothetical protein